MARVIRTKNAEHFENLQNFLSGVEKSTAELVHFERKSEAVYCCTLFYLQSDTAGPAV